MVVQDAGAHAWKFAIFKKKIDKHNHSKLSNICKLKTKTIAVKTIFEGLTFLFNSINKKQSSPTGGHQRRNSWRLIH